MANTRAFQPTSSHGSPPDGRCGAARVVGTCLFAGVLACIAPGSASAQTSLKLASPADAINKRHIRLRAVTGHPCLEFHMRVRPEVVMEHTFDHLVGVTNSCTQRIAVRICYKDATTGCQIVKVHPRAEKTILLGVMHDQPTFVFDFTEAFDQ